MALCARRLSAAAVLALGAQGVCAQSPSPPDNGLPAIEDFFRPPQMARPVLSPNGRFLAASVAGPSGRLQLAVIDLEKPSASTAVASLSDADITQYRWVNDERLVFSIYDAGEADWSPSPGLWAVNRDGTRLRQLIENYRSGFFVDRISPVESHRLTSEWRLAEVLRDGSSDVLAVAGRTTGTGDFLGTTLVRLDTLTGRSVGLSDGAPPYVVDWVVDEQGRPVFATAWAKNRVVSYRKGADGWQVWLESDAFSRDQVLPYRVTGRGELFVLARRDSDFVALYRADPQTGKLEERPIASAPGYDLDGGIIVDRESNRVLGVRYETDAHGTAWLDAGMRDLQSRIDRLLPGTVNLVECEHCLSAKSVLVTAYSDRQPEIYYLFERTTGSLVPVGSRRPWIRPDRMAPRDVMRMKARDGLSVPVLVTRPPGAAKGPLPAVVLVHGGPNVRGTHWGWEPIAQFLASRGYVVIEPEFRGSVGYGFSHFRAGWKQWGQTMQDDVADATQWAAAQGWIDPKRTCIAGASFGGYATLMGLIRYPQLYECGFEWVGVTDIELMYSITWSDLSEFWKRYGMPTLIGDRDADAAMLQAVSPLRHAQQVTRPLLMAYGAEDRRVPIKHGTAFRDAVTKTNPDVEWIVYGDEAHGWRNLKTNLDFWSRVERFLDRNIGAGASPAAARTD